MAVKTIIHICESIGIVLTVLGGIMFSINNHKIAGIWITFSGIIILLLALALYLQSEVSKEEKPIVSPLLAPQPSIFLEAIKINSISGGTVTWSMLIKASPTAIATNIKIYASGLLFTNPKRDLFYLDSCLSYKDLSPNEEKTITSKLEFNNNPHLKNELAGKQQFLFVFGKIYYNNEIDNEKKYQKEFCTLYNVDTGMLDDVQHYKIVHGEEYPNKK